MKTESGVTLTSLIIYVIAMVIVVALVGTLTNYFYGNIDSLINETEVSKEYTAFNSYFTNDVNQKGNELIKDIFTGTRIVFSNGNQYAFVDDSIYFNKILICKYVNNCRFDYNDSTKQITVNMNISGNNYTNTYKLNF